MPATKPRVSVVAAIYHFDACIDLALYREGECFRVISIGPSPNAPAIASEHFEKIQRIAADPAGFVRQMWPDYDVVPAVNDSAPTR